MRLYSKTHSVHVSRKDPHVLPKHAGAAHLLFVVLIALSLISSGLYVFSVNRSAVQGYAIRTLEKDLKELKKANAELRVREAEAKSLERVEQGSLDLRMEKAETETVLKGNSDSVALR